MRFHRALGVGVLLLLGPTGCGTAVRTGASPLDVVDPGPPPSVSASPSLGPAAPLTGMAVDNPALAARPAIAVPFRVGAGAAAPIGLDSADVVYQEYAEGGTLRLVGLYQSKDAARVGPVAEIRPADVKTVSVLSPFVAYGGGPPGFVNQLADAALPAVSKTQRADLFPGGYTSSAALYPVAPAGTSAPPPLMPYGDAEEPLAKTGVAAASTLTVTSPAHGAQVWTFDPVNHLWRSSVGGAQVAVASVVVLTMPYKTVRSLPSAEVIGEGSAVTVSGGFSASGRWTKPAAKQMCNVIDLAGYPMRPQAGSAWVVYLPVGGTVTAA